MSQFAALKVEKEELQREIDSSRATENKWKEAVSKMRREIDTMNGKINTETDKHMMQNQELEARDAQNAVKLKLLQNENRDLTQERQKALIELQERELELDTVRR